MHRSVLLAFVLLAACGDDTHVHPVDAPPATMTHQALVVSGDFNMTGLMSKLDLSTMEVMQNIGGTGAVGGDPVIRRIGDRIYVINRANGGSITVFDANTLAFLDQYGTGSGSNPQDIAVVGTSLYIPALGTSGIVKIDTSTLAITTIDLSSLDPDGKPDCVSAYAVGTKVYVACGTLDEFYAPRGPGKVVVLDTTTDAVTATITLPTPNPYNFIVQSPESSVFGGDLLIPLLPSFTDYSTGCIARLSTGSVPAVACASGLTNAEIGGTVAHMDVAHDGSMLWMAVGTLQPASTGSLKGFDLAGGSLWAAAVSPSAQTIQDLAACPDGSVVVADGTFGASGLRVYKDTAEVTTAPIGFGLPPTFGNAVVCYTAVQ